MLPIKKVWQALAENDAKTPEDVARIFIIHDHSALVTSALWSDAEFAVWNPDIQSFDINTREVVIRGNALMWQLRFGGKND